MGKMKRVITYIINLTFFLYFLLLLVERIVSVSLSFANGVNIFSDGFNGYVYMLVFVSITAWLVYLAIRCRPAFKALFVINEDTLSAIPFKDLCIASGILLLSGMVHTEYTISILQFISYGILIIGILHQVILMPNKGALKWLSFIYLVCFSMAIPVMYRSYIEYSILFHITEAVASISLVTLFTFMMILLFHNEDNLFMFIPVIVMTILDTILIVLRWKEEIHWFVLIFMVLSIVMVVVGFIYKQTQKKN